MNADGPFQMLISTLDYSPYLGQLAIGRIERGCVHLGDQVLLLPLDGEPVRFKVTKLFTFENMQHVEVAQASAGEIISLAGLENMQIGATICDP